MGIRNRQIGKSTETNLWYEVLKSIRSIRKALTPKIPVPNPNIGILRITFLAEIPSYYFDLYGSGNYSINWGNGEPIQTGNFSSIGSFSNSQPYTIGQEYTITVTFPDKTLITGFSPTANLGASSVDISTLPNINYFVLLSINSLSILLPNQLNQLLYTLDNNGLSNGVFQITQLGNSQFPDSGPPNGLVAEANLIAKGWNILIN